MKRLVIIVFIFSIFITGCGNTKHEKDVFSITPKEVYKISQSEDKNKVIIDVRTKEEYVSGHINNAINIPVEEIENIDISKSKEIIVYCRSGRRSYDAANILADKGYLVYDMGGINNWTYELER